MLSFFSDMFRNMVHLPFFLQNAGLRKIKVAQYLSSKQKSKQQTMEGFLPVFWIQIHWIWIRIQVRIRIQGYSINFERKKFKIILEKNNFPWNKYIFLNYKNKLSPREIFNPLGLWIVN